jgi:hypothetical protein
MKIRKGFVSNSSSSSFVIIDPNEENKANIHFEGNVIKVPQTYGGNTFFDRTREKYFDFGSKLNWAFFLAYSMDSFQASYGDIVSEHNKDLFTDKWWDNHSLKDYHNLVTRVKSVLLKGLGIPSIVSIEIYLNNDKYDEDYHPWWKNKIEIKEEDYVYGHIDHQSDWMERPENLIIFNNGENNLFQFLFHVNSFIQGNDEY